MTLVPSVLARAAGRLAGRPAATGPSSRISQEKNNNGMSPGRHAMTGMHKVTGMCQSRHTSTEPEPKRTALYDFHVAKGGKMVPFAGYAMPVSYPDLSHPASHMHTREHVSIFDVSHMLQSHIYGKDRIAFIESLVVADVQGLKDNQGSLTLFTTDSGGIIDDLIVTKTDQGFLYVVSNAGCIDKDWAHLKAAEATFKAAGKDVTIEAQERSLIAVQGPGMAKVLKEVVGVDMDNLKFMTSTTTSVFGVPECRVTRCGYTGEDGVEISVSNDKITEVTEGLLSSTADDVRLAGLGARDSLRLEAGLCLYGNDIDETTTPVEATLAWTIGKRRREAKDFPGAELIMTQLKAKPIRKRVGFVSSGPPARAGTKILDEAGAEIGVVTSGCPSPCLKGNVAMGYVTLPYSKNGTSVQFEVRKKKVPAIVSKMPFVPSNYFN